MPGMICQICERQEAAHMCYTCVNPAVEINVYGGVLICEQCKVSHHNCGIFLLHQTKSLHSQHKKELLQGRIQGFQMSTIETINTEILKLNVGSSLNKAKCEFARGIIHQQLMEVYRALTDQLNLKEKDLNKEVESSVSAIQEQYDTYRDQLKHLSSSIKASTEELLQELSDNSVDFDEGNVESKLTQLEDSVKKALTERIENKLGPYVVVDRGSFDKTNAVDISSFKMGEIAFHPADEMLQNPDLLPDKMKLQEDTAFDIPGSFLTRTMLNSRQTLLYLPHPVLLKHGKTIIDAIEYQLMQNFEQNKLTLIMDHELPSFSGNKMVAVKINAHDSPQFMRCIFNLPDADKGKWKKRAKDKSTRDVSLEPVDHYQLPTKTLPLNKVHFYKLDPFLLKLQPLLMKVGFNNATNQDPLVDLTPHSRKRIAKLLEAGSTTEMKVQLQSQISDDVIQLWSGNVSIGECSFQSVLEEDPEPDTSKLCQDIRLLHGGDLPVKREVLGADKSSNQPSPSLTTLPQSDEKIHSNTSQLDGEPKFSSASTTSQNIVTSVTACYKNSGSHQALNVAPHLSAAQNLSSANPVANYGNVGNSETHITSNTSQGLAETFDNRCVNGSNPNDNTNNPSYPTSAEASKSVLSTLKQLEKVYTQPMSTGSDGTSDNQAQNYPPATTAVTFVSQTPLYDSGHLNHQQQWCPPTTNFVSSVHPYQANDSVSSGYYSSSSHDHHSNPDGSSARWNSDVWGMQNSKWDEAARRSLRYLTLILYGEGSVEHINSPSMCEPPANVKQKWAEEIRKQQRVWGMLSPDLLQLLIDVETRRYPDLVDEFRRFHVPMNIYKLPFALGNQYAAYLQKFPELKSVMDMICNEQAVLREKLTNMQQQAASANNHSQPPPTSYKPPTMNQDVEEGAGDFVNPSETHVYMDKNGEQITGMCLNDAWNSHRSSQQDIFQVSETPDSTVSDNGDVDLKRRRAADLKTLLKRSTSESSITQHSDTAYDRRYAESNASTEEADWFKDETSSDIVTSSYRSTAIPRQDGPMNQQQHNSDSCHSSGKKGNYRSSYPNANNREGYRRNNSRFMNNKLSYQGGSSY